MSEGPRAPLRVSPTMAMSKPVSAYLPSGPRPIVLLAVLDLIVLALVGVLAHSAAAMTSHAGWPRDEHLLMDRGPAGRSNTLVGEPGKHNYLLGGYGDDTIYGGDAGDVIWGDYHPSGWPARQTAVIHAGNGKNFIYANDTVNYVWTGPTRPPSCTRTRALA
jgi:hypothetical protein